MSPLFKETLTKSSGNDIYIFHVNHYNDVKMGAMASQITSLIIVYSTVYSGAGQRKHQSSASLAVLRGIQRWPVNSPHRWPVTRKMFSFDDAIMIPCKYFIDNDSSVVNRITTLYNHGFRYFLQILLMVCLEFVLRQSYFFNTSC